jgi:hypothetical protein
MMAKPKVGDYYWFHGGYEHYLVGKAVRVKKVVKGWECLLEVVTKGELDNIFSVDKPFTQDVRHLFDLNDYISRKDWLEDVSCAPITPVTVKKDSAAKWKQRFEYLLRASKTEQTFLASHKNLDLVVKEIDDMLDNV